MMTKRQIQVLKLVRAAIRRDGVPPTLVELAEITALSANTIRNTFLDLEAAGFIRRRHGKCRSLVILRVPAELRAT